MKMFEIDYETRFSRPQFELFSGLTFSSDFINCCSRLWRFCSSFVLKLFGLRRNFETSNKTS